MNFDISWNIFSKYKVNLLDHWTKLFQTIKLFKYLILFCHYIIWGFTRVLSQWESIKSRNIVTAETFEDGERVIRAWESRYSVIVITHIILPILFSNSTLKSLFPINIRSWFSKGFYLFRKLNGQVGGPLRLRNLHQNEVIWILTMMPRKCILRQ